MAKQSKKKDGTTGGHGINAAAESYETEQEAPIEHRDEPRGPPGPSTEPRRALESESIRLAREDWEALEQIAERERRQTGRNSSPSAIARRFIRWGIRQAIPQTKAPAVVV